MIRKINYLIVFIIAVAFFLRSSGVKAEVSELLSVDAQESFQGISVFWEKPFLSENEDVVLIRKEGVCPTSVKDGIEIYAGDRSFFEDLNLEAGKIYCYGAFIYDYSGNFSTFHITKAIEKKSHAKYLIYQMIRNNNLALGLAVIMALFWINKATMKKRIENNRVVMKI